jgi:hypothetical protein
MAKRQKVSVLAEKEGRKSPNAKKLCPKDVIKNAVWLNHLKNPQDVVLLNVKLG